jgi:SAM-dependent methyltransferase
MKKLEANTNIDSTNHASYSDPELINTYRKQQHLQAGELAILKHLGQQIQDQPILDLGIGAGRTILPLSKVSQNYVGVDYSALMVEAAREEYPDKDLRAMDARDLSAFAEGSFQFVLFSFNGIDYVTHEGRLQVLAEVLRVLRPGGWFAFSSHNRAAYGKPVQSNGPSSAQPPKAKRSLLRLLVGARNRLYYLLAGWYYRMKNRGLEFRCESYAILRDLSQLRSLLTYHVTLAAQVQQLSEVGFTSGSVLAYDDSGQVVTADDSSPWIYYLARKPA